MSDPSSRIESLRSYLLHETRNPRHPIDLVVRALAENDELLDALQQSSSPTVTMLTTASRFLFPDLDSIASEAAMGDGGTAEQRVRDAVLPLVSRRAHDMRTVLADRAPQTNNPGRAEYVKRALHRMDRHLGTKRYLLIEVGASEGALLGELQKVDPQSIFVGTDPHPLQPNNLLHARWQLSHPVVVKPASGPQSAERMREGARRVMPPLVVEGSGRSGAEDVIRRLREAGTIDDDTPIVLLESCVRPYFTEDEKQAMDEFVSAPDTAPRIHIVIDGLGFLSDVASEFINDDSVRLAVAVTCGDGERELVAVGDVGGSRIVEVGPAGVSYAEAHEDYLASRRSRGDVSSITAPDADANEVRRILQEMIRLHSDDPLLRGFVASATRRDFKQEAHRLDPIDPMTAELLRRVADHPALLHPLEHSDRSDVTRQWLVAARFVAPELLTLFRDVQEADYSRVAEQVVELLYERHDDLTAALIRPPQPDFLRAEYLRRALADLGDEIQHGPFLVIQTDAGAGVALASVRDSYSNAVLIGLDKTPLSVDDIDTGAWLKAHTETDEHGERLEQMITTTKAELPGVLEGEGIADVEAIIQRLRSEGTVEPEMPVVLVEMSSREALPRATTLDGFATTPDSALRAHIRIDRAQELPPGQMHPLVQDAGKYLSEVIVTSVQVGEKRRVVTVGDSTGEIVNDVNTIDERKSESQASPPHVRRPAVRRAVRLEQPNPKTGQEGRHVEPDAAPPSLLAGRGPSVRHDLGLDDVRDGLVEPDNDGIEQTRPDTPDHGGMAPDR